MNADSVDAADRDATATADADADTLGGAGRGPPAVELDGVTKEYDSGAGVVRALDDVDFVARPGEFIAVMGPSGSGKSTMLNVLGLLDEPTSGEVRLAGEPVSGLSDRERTDQRRKYIGFVFQDFYLIPSLSAVENVEMPTLFTPGDGRERAADLLRTLGLGNRLDHRPTELSGGQQQRVAVARSLVNRPQVVLADEPTGNLDTETGRSVLEEFTRIKDEERVAVVAVTHDDLVTEYADRVVNLVDGVVVEDIATARASSRVDPNERAGDDERDDAGESADGEWGGAP